MSHTFLVELGTQELPPTSLKDLSDAFSKNICDALKAKEITFEKSQSFATPRRLALVVEGLKESTPLKEVTVWGPPAKIAFDAEGKPTKAALAFAKKNELAIEDLQKGNDGKQDKLMCQKSIGGEKTRTLLGDIVRQSLANLPIKKRMRWGASRVEFVRPVQWLTLMVDKEVIQEEILAVKASNKTFGHRFHANIPLEVESIDSYEKLLLEKGKVVADFEKRKALVADQVKKAAKKIGGHAVVDDALLEEVTALVEWPVALSGKFDASFLSVPSEALISSMNEHQKYFHVVNENDDLMPYFITVSNIDSKDPQQVIDGNERVIRPRLADAAFFFETDKKVSLAERREKLKTLTFQAKLGSVYQKTERIKKLGRDIAESLSVNTELVESAAALCKSDLVSSMVYEFPDMQGIAGFHYAKHEGLNDEIALAINEQYLPKFAGDAVPSSDTGAIIALADRIDTVTGIFAIGERPSGSKDPFALRRASLGILRILVEKSYSLDLKQLVEKASSAYEDVKIPENLADDVVDYCLDRFKAWYQDADIAPEVFQSVQAKHLTNALDINHRVHAVATFSKLPQAPALAEANKRVSNILAKQTEVQMEGLSPDYSVFEKQEENRLADALKEAVEKASPLLKEQRYAEALSVLAFLKEPIDAFFDEVMVMTEDASVRKNRLLLLNQLRDVFLEVADISHLVIKS